MYLDSHSKKARSAAAQLVSARRGADMTASKALYSRNYQAAAHLGQHIATRLLIGANWTHGSQLRGEEWCAALLHWGAATTHSHTTVVHLLSRCLIIQLWEYSPLVPVTYTAIVGEWPPEYTRAVRNTTTITHCDTYMQIFDQSFLNAILIH